jgi:hypothetical protein
VYAAEIPVSQVSQAPNPGVVCYNLEQRTKIAQAITDLKKCQVDLSVRNELIQKNMLTLDGLNPGPAWWQEPSFVFGDMVVSVAVGGIVTFLLLRDK